MISGMTLKDRSSSVIDHEIFGNYRVQNYLHFSRPKLSGDNHSSIYRLLLTSRVLLALALCCKRGISSKSENFFCNNWSSSSQALMSCMTCKSEKPRKVRQKKKKKNGGGNCPPGKCTVFGGGKCPNLGVVNVRILGVVNVRLANNLTPSRD